MKTFKKMAAQGDVLFIRIDRIPAGLKKETPENGNFIVTHSESGHHHVIDAEKTMLYRLESNPMICYLSVLEPCEIKHLRSFDTHESIRFEIGDYEIKRQRGHSPEGWIMIQD